LQSVENVWGCGNSEGSEGKQAEWNRECCGLIYAPISNYQISLINLLNNKDSQNK